MDVFVARQPIFNLKNKVFAYELLFRNGFENTFPDIDSDLATTTLLSNTFLSFELKDLLRSKPGFINFTKRLILEKTPLLFPENHMVIEVLENIEPDEEVTRSLDEFREKGYRVALDDFSFEKKFSPLIAHSDIIKIDFKEYTVQEIDSFIRTLDPESMPILLAEKLETYEEYEEAKELGFSLFQGYFFSKPEIISRSDIPASQAIKLQLISELRKKDFSRGKIQELIKKDVAISFKLLKFINSAYYYRPHPINTIKDAITYIGMDELKKFIMIMTVSDLSTGRFDELLRRSVIRARMCEMIGTVMNTDFSNDELFTLGLFTLMDALMNTRMADILEKVNFSDRMKDALLGKDKGFNLILHIIESFERGQWEKKIFKAITGKKIANKLPTYYLDAIKMSDSLFETAIPSPSS